MKEAATNGLQQADQLLASAAEMEIQKITEKEALIISISAFMPTQETHGSSTTQQHQDTSEPSAAQQEKTTFQTAHPGKNVKTPDLTETETQQSFRLLILPEATKTSASETRFMSV